MEIPGRVCYNKQRQRIPGRPEKAEMPNESAKEVETMLTAITGINWGDEGKGRMVDLLSQDYDIVARYQGGDNAGHTVKNERASSS